MKKFFIHNGTQQDGPFDIEELKQKNISKETMVWFNGLETWTKADNIPDIKDILSLSPPPFNQTNPPLPSQGSTANKSASLPLKKKKSAWKTISKIIIAILVIIGALVLLDFINNADSSFMQVKLNLPSPRVVEQRAGEDPASDIIDFKEAVYAIVLNQGGDGRILVTARLEQDGNNYHRSEEIFIRANETHNFHFTFNEVKILGGKMTYYVEAKSIE